MAYNLKVKRYLDCTQIRYYTNNVKEGQKRKEKDITESAKQTEQQKIEVNRCSGSRSKQTIFDIIRCNKWEWFVTLTFDRTKIDSSNYDDVVRAVSSWVKYMKAYYAPDLQYLFVPELHKDKKHFHVHGLIADTGSIKFINSGHVIAGDNIYNMPNWQYGFTTASQVKDTHRLSSYISKYITKDLDQRLKGRKRYWRSKNLNVPEEETYSLTADQYDSLLGSLTKNMTYSKTINNPKACYTETILEVDFLLDL